MRKRHFSARIDIDVDGTVGGSEFHLQTAVGKRNAVTREALGSSDACTSESLNCGPVRVIDKPNAPDGGAYNLIG